MDGTGPPCPGCGDGEADLHLPSSSLPFSTSPLMDREGTDGRLEGCLADGFLDSLIPPALSE
eukprot:8267864-Prorocentrum_lima.AAC.1